jgi:hypothetical protein
MKKVSILQGLIPARATRVVVYLKPINMRLGPAKLHELCRDTLGIEPDASTMFLFTNKGHDCLLMYFVDQAVDQTMMKKLDKGSFLLPVPEQEGEPFVIMKAPMLARLFRS